MTHKETVPEKSPDDFVVFPTPQMRAIVELNDRFRQTHAGGRVFITRGIQSLGPDSLRSIMQKVSEFDQFSPANDPYGEHDFGSFEHDGEKVFWKIDYFDPQLTNGSADPSDPKQTSRVLTVMLASEY